MGVMEMGADKKIYLSAENDIVTIPYPDSVHTSVCDNLSVINYPDSLGQACNFQPYSFYQGGNKVYIGLPNNPDYTLGPMYTLTAVHELTPVLTTNELKIFYHPA